LDFSLDTVDGFVRKVPCMSAFAVDEEGGRGVDGFGQVKPVRDLVGEAEKIRAHAGSRDE
jgi:hypothetical protein